MAYKDFVPYNWPDIPTGTTFPQKEITASFDLAGWSVDMEFVNESGFKYNPVVSIVSGKVRINQFDVNWTPGGYKYYIRFTSPAGVKKKYFRGTMRVNG